jgi:hypothetical protein
MELALEHQRQLRLAEWIDTHLSCAYQLPSRSLQLAHPCFDIVVEHHAAICLLRDAELFGSMYSLIRIQLEALVNGLWLRHVAIDDDLTKYEKDDLNLGFGTRVKLIEEKFGISGGFLSHLKKAQWDIFCSFAHSGYQAIVRRVGEVHTGTENYKSSEIVTMLRKSGLFAVLAAVELASMMGDKKLIEAAMNMARGYGEDEL